MAAPLRSTLILVSSCRRRICSCSSPRRIAFRLRQSSRPCCNRYYEFVAGVSAWELIFACTLTYFHNRDPRSLHLYPLRCDVNKRPSPILPAASSPDNFDHDMETSSYVRDSRRFSMAQFSVVSIQTSLALLPRADISFVRQL